MSFVWICSFLGDCLCLGWRFYIASEDAARASKEQQAVINALVGSSPESFKKQTKYFYDKTRELIKAQSWTTVGATKNNVDIVRDVLKYVPVYWAAELVSVELGFALRV